MNSRTLVHTEGRPTRTQAEAPGQSPSKNLDTVPMNSSENNGCRCRWRGHPAQPTNHLMPRSAEMPTIVLGECRIITPERRNTPGVQQYPQASAACPKSPTQGRGGCPRGSPPPKKNYVFAHPAPVRLHTMKCIMQCQVHRLYHCLAYKLPSCWHCVCASLGLVTSTNALGLETHNICP